jgi:hypothetical protein
MVALYISHAIAYYVGWHRCWAYNDKCRDNMMNSLRTVLAEVGHMKKGNEEDPQ